MTTGAAFASTAFAGGIDAHAASVMGEEQAGPITILLIDETIVVPRRLAALVQSDGRRLPELAVRLDAAGQQDLRRMFGQADAVVGISSGATLFCLERQAWDHGFRLTARSQQHSDDVAALRDLAKVAGGAMPTAADRASLARAYRPSRADGLIHVWTMHKSGRPAVRQATPEITT
jgi:hypothetical protein